MKKTTYVIILLTLMTAIFSGCSNWELINSEKRAKQKCEDIITDADKKYEIKFYLYIVCAEDKDKEEMSIRSDSGEERIIGEFIK